MDRQPHPRPSAGVVRAEKRYAALSVAHGEDVMVWAKAAIERDNARSSAGQTARGRQQARPVRR